MHKQNKLYLLVSIGIFLELLMSSISNLACYISSVLLTLVGTGQE